MLVSCVMDWFRANAYFATLVTFSQSKFNSMIFMPPTHLSLMARRQVLVRSLGCEHSRRCILKHEIILKYNGMIGRIEFYLFVIDSASKKKEILLVFKKNVVYFVKIWVTIS